MHHLEHLSLENTQLPTIENSRFACAITVEDWMNEMVIEAAPITYDFKGGIHGKVPHFVLPENTSFP